MRRISKNAIEGCLTQAWRDSALAAKTTLNAAATSADRKKILDKASSSQVWRDFYELLPENIKSKCWYCESEEIRSDMPVDHFRPKNLVDGVPNHEGYWWLAFDWENYRCACTFCNSRRVFDDTSGGKACKFPLVDEKQRAYTSIQPIANEQPDLLDPFDPDDWKLLWFDNDGEPIPKDPSSADQQRKVRNSIDIFHLHEKRIVRARNDIRIKVEKEIKKIQECEGNKAIELEAKNALMDMVRDTEKHSKAAIVYMRNHRNMAAVKEILELD